MRFNSIPKRADHAAACAAVLVALFASSSASAQPNPETILQYFETSWPEITARMPEIAQAGYTAIWLPPPTKGAEGIVDVGFSVFDRFDLGDVDQRGTLPTRYGTRNDAVLMVAEAHRFGIKVYFDTVMNHNANPAKIENAGVNLPPAAIDEFPGTHPLDYHVLPARSAGGDAWEVRNPAIFGGGTYVMRPDMGANEPIVAVTPMPMDVNIPGYTHLARAPWIDFSNAGPLQEQHLSLLGLIDFGLEQQIDNGRPAANDGMNLVSEQPLPRYIRHPNQPETYPNATPVEEDVREMMVRWIKWFGEVTDADGLRLDAIKHVPPEFFAVDFANDPIAFNQAFQDSLDERRGWTDSDDDDGRQDALLFGESFTGDFGSLGLYRNTGMFLLDFPLLFGMANDGGVFAQDGAGDIGQLSFPQGGMGGQFTEFGGLGRNAGVSFVQSHDTRPPGAQPNGAYAFTLTRIGHSVVFYDGNNFTSTSFVEPGRLDALGELGSTVITDLVGIRRGFARGGMFNRFVDGDTYVYERVVPTTDGTGGATLLVAVTDNTGGEARFGEFDSRPLLVSEFPPGTVLDELTGNGTVTEITVLDPTVVPEEARNRAIAEYDRSSDFPLPSSYGLVYLQIPQGPNSGYVAYAPRTPPLSVQLSDGTAPLVARAITTVGERRTPAGARIAPSVINPGMIARGAALTVQVATNPDAAQAYLRINGGVALPGTTLESGTPEGLYDGFIALTAVMGTQAFELSGADLSGLDDGVHLATVRVVRAGTPSFYREAHAMFVIDSGLPPPTDGGVTPPTDGGGAPPTDGGVITPPGDAGTGPLDSGTIDPDQDPDRDGIPTGIDSCPNVANEAQRDFDEDGVGDACDDCPSTGDSAVVDADGCVPLEIALRARLDAIVTAILEERFDASLDVNGDAVIDATDFVLAAPGGAQ